MEEDTDTLLAMLISTLESPVPDESTLLDFLASANGNVEAASRAIQTTRRSTLPQRVKKRKRSGFDLDNWLVNKNPRNPTGKNGDSKEDATYSGEEVAGPSTSPSKLPKTMPSEPSTPSSSKVTVDLMQILRAPPPTIPAPPRFPPLSLPTPAMVAQHTPCTLHPSILPQELACRLFYAMIDESRRWGRNKWWLFEKVVESPHRTSFYARRQSGVDTNESWEEAAQFWYNGRKTEPPSQFLPEMDEACEYIEQVVNSEMCKRKRYPLEYGGEIPGGVTWRANVAASNCYEGGKEGVGPHSDQLTYLGPYPTIASLSLGTTRTFRLREVVPTPEKNDRHARTYNVPLTHNSLIIMHASTQERFKHSIPPQSRLDMFHPAFPRTPDAPIEPSNCRINITFRFYRPDFRPHKTPRCNCGVPTVLKPDMKNRQDGKTDKYWWTCYAGAQNDGKGCNLWKVMDVQAEGRGPFISSES